MRRPPAAIRGVFERADLCHVATTTPSGPHATPMVFAFAGDRLWVTTSRRSVKAGAWSRDPRVAGVVRHGREAVAFVGDVVRHDVLEAGTWGRSMREIPTLALATARFTRKNARFFAGYAVDAHQVPLAWTPPGRMFAELRPERTALLRDLLVEDTWGTWGNRLPTKERFRATRAGRDPLGALPHEVREDLGRRGDGVLVLETGAGVVAIPSAWAVSGSALYAVLPASILAIADLSAPTVRASLEVDRSSRWRARDMLGTMARGEGDVFLPSGLVAGGRSAATVAREAGIDPGAAAVVRIRAQSFVWWRGWSSGTVWVR